VPTRDNFVNQRTSRSRDALPPLQHFSISGSRTAGASRSAGLPTAGRSTVPQQDPSAGTEVWRQVGESESRGMVLFVAASSWWSWLVASAAAGITAFVGSQAAGETAGVSQALMNSSTRSRAVASSHRTGGLFMK
jgi:hypothetical protein